MTLRSIFAFLLLGIILFSCLYLVINSTRARAHHDAYRSLQLEQQRSLVEKNFRRAPEETYKIDECTCAYYEGSSLAAHRVKPQASVLQTLDELPFVYDSIQILFDSQEKVIAFSWMGEGGTSSVAGGNAMRSHFRSLPPEALAALKRRCAE